MIRSTIKTSFTINLDSSQENVYFLLGIVPSLIKQINRLSPNSFKETPDEIINKMMSDDYYNAVLTFDKYFGNYVILETSNKNLLDLIS